MKFKEKEIEINDITLTIRERKVQDVLDTEDFFSDTELKDSDSVLFLKKHIVMLYHALKHNWEDANFFDFKKKKLASTFSISNMMNNISPRQLWELSIILYELEGLDTTVLKMLAGKLSKEEIENYFESIKKKAVIQEKK